MPVLTGECALGTHPRKLLISFNSLGGVPKETPGIAKTQRLNHTKLLANFGKSIERSIQIRSSVRSRNLRTQSCLAAGHYRIPETLDVYAVLQQLLTHVLGYRCFAQHHRNYRVPSFNDLETQFDNASPE